MCKFPFTNFNHLSKLQLYKVLMACTDLRIIIKQRGILLEVSMFV